MEPFRPKPVGGIDGEMMRPGQPAWRGQAGASFRGLKQTLGARARVRPAELSAASDGREALRSGSKTLEAEMRGFPPPQNEA